MTWYTYESINIQEIGGLDVVPADYVHIRGVAKLSRNLCGISPAKNILIP